MMISRWEGRLAAGLVGLVWLVAACSGKVSGGGRDDASATVDAGQPSVDARGELGVFDGGSSTKDAALQDASVADAAMFHCEPQDTASPVLDGVMLFDPASPIEGDTVTVLVKSSRLDRQHAPVMSLDVEGPEGSQTRQVNHMGGGDALYFYTVPSVVPGDYCLLGSIDGAPEISGRFSVVPRTQPPPRCQGGVFKVITNHQWTCDEQPEYGNELYVITQDAAGNPIPNVRIRVSMPDTTAEPIFNEDERGLPPTTVQTDEQGQWHGHDWWPINDNGYLVLEFSVDGCPSDIATEITTGWWETDNYGCVFCPGSATKNHWGHWSHTVVFALDQSAGQACVVPSDHAGQVGCAVEHIYHDPLVEACWQVP